MNRTITTEETRQLFEFCEKKGVKYYDVQTELVDHLASDIEELWICQPEINLDDAITQTFKKFGYLGFRKITNQKRKVLTTAYRSMVWSFFKAYYTWPKIIGTVCVSLFLFALMSYFGLGIKFILIILFFLAIPGTAYYFKEIKWYKSIRIIKKRKFLFIEQYNGLISAFVILALGPIQLLNINRLNDYFSHSLFLLIVSFVTTAFIILLTGGIFYVPKKFKQHFFEQFPELAA